MHTYIKGSFCYDINVEESVEESGIIIPVEESVEESGIIIPGSTANSDLSASVAFIKNKLRAKLQANQKTGRVTEW